MAITYRYGEQEVKDLARQAGKAQAAQQQLQRQFQKEMGIMQFQMGLEQQRRAQMWELEKAEIASRNDFGREERIRAQKLEERDRKLKAIEESDIIPPDKKEYYRMQVMGVEGMASPTQQAQIDVQQRNADIKQQELDAKLQDLANDEEKKKAFFNMLDNSDMDPKQREDIKLRVAGAEAGYNIPAGMIEAPEVKPPKEATILDIQRLTKELSRFKENGTDYRGFDQTYDLAIVNEDGKVKRGASDLEKQLYPILKQQLLQATQQLAGQSVQSGMTQAVDLPPAPKPGQKLTPGQVKALKKKYNDDKDKAMAEAIAKGYTL